jgi:hypothetical protein
MRRLLLVLLAPLALGACAPPRAAAAPSLLPLRSLRLYETGVGYFERSGELTGSATLPVPAGHLDDALKSLVMISAAGPSKVGGLAFPSSVSKGMARALSGLPVDGDAPLSYRDLLVSLKGAEVELSQAGGSLRGRLIEVVGRDVPVKHDPVADGDRSSGDGSPGAARAHDPPPASAGSDDLTLLILTARGEMQRVKVADIARVRPLDPAFAARLGTTLDALSSRSTQVERSLRLFGEQRGPVTFGYVTETPAWRPSYRVVFDPDGKSARVQGWALLHNDTEEDWNSIRLELVNGRPDAFIFPLAAPRYLRRELVHPDEALSTIPQLLQQTPDTMWGDQIGDSFGAGGLGLSGVGEGGGGRGEGIGLGSIGTIGHGAGVGTGQGASDLLNVGNLAATAKATGVESGALFRYALAEPLYMAAHSSALVPFLDQPIGASFLTFVDESHVDVVRAGVRFANTTGQTLPAGPVSFFADGGFAGDSAIDRLKPQEQRFVTFGADLDVALKITRPSVSDEWKRVVFARDRLEEHYLHTTVRSVDIEVRSLAPRDLYLSLNIRPNASLTGADAVDFDTPTNRPIAVLHLVPMKKVARTLTSVEGLESAVAFESLTSELLSALASHASLPPAERAALTDAAARELEVEKTVKSTAEKRAEIDEIEKDLVRLREHLKALSGEKGASVDGAPFVKRILAAEDRLTAARQKVDALEQERAARKKAVRAALSVLATKVGP